MLQRSLSRKSLPGRPSIVPSQKLNSSSKNHKENTSCAIDENFLRESNNSEKFHLLNLFSNTQNKMNSKQIFLDSFSGTLNEHSKSEPKPSDDIQMFKDSISSFQDLDSSKNLRQSIQKLTNSYLNNTIISDQENILINNEFKSSNIDIINKFKDLSVKNIQEGEKVSHANVLNDRRHSMIPLSNTKQEEQNITIRPFQTPHHKKPSRRIFTHHPKKANQRLQIYQEDLFNENEQNSTMTDIPSDEKATNINSNSHLKIHSTEEITKTANPSTHVSFNSNATILEISDQSDNTNLNHTESLKYLSLNKENGITMKDTPFINTQEIRNLAPHSNELLFQLNEIDSSKTNQVNIQDLIDKYLNRNGDLNEFIEKMKILDKKLETISHEYPQKLKLISRKRKASNRTPQSKKSKSKTLQKSKSIQNQKDSQYTPYNTTDCEVSTPYSPSTSNQRKKRKKSYSPQKNDLLPISLLSSPSDDNEVSPRRSRTQHLSSKKSQSLESQEILAKDLNIYNLNLSNSPISLEPTNTLDPMSDDNEAQVNFLMEKLSVYAKVQFIDDDNCHQFSSTHEYNEEDTTSITYITQLKECIDQLDSSMPLSSILFELKKKCSFLFEM